jgi:hypothetical protein
VNRLSRLAFPLLAALTLGLAPFFPEPHVIGKLRWMVGGAVGMTAVDWFDLVLHGAPWVWLLVAAVLELWRAPADRAPRWIAVALLVALAFAVLCVAVAILR